MVGLTKCITLTLMVLSLIYLMTRIQSFYELQASKKEITKGVFTGSVAYKYENMELLHYFTIAHSVTCVVISVFVYMVLKRNQMIDRRQYYFVLGVTTVVTFLYFFALVYIVYRGTVVQSRSYNAIVMLESILDVIGSISSNPFAFLFALLMNFILLFGLFCLNLCSIYLADLARSMEQRRTGGREQNELELNSLVSARSISAPKASL